MGSKPDDFLPFPVKEQLPGVDYCITSPPRWAEACLLGFQHYVVCLGAIVLIANIVVPQMGGGHEEKAKLIQTILFVTAINTLLQLYFGTRLPAVITASHTFVLPTLSIIFSRRYSYFLEPHERFIHTMRGIQGALIIASCLQIVLGFMGVWGIVIRFLSPLSAVPLVTLAGLGLFYLGFPIVASCIEVGLPEIILLVFLSQYVPYAIKGKRVIFDRFALMFAVVIVWVYAHILTASGAYKHTKPSTQYSCRTDRAFLISTAPWIRVPYPLQWGSPTFDAGEAFAMMAASLVALVESTGAFIAVQRYASATHVPPSIYSRGAGWLVITFSSGIYTPLLYQVIQSAFISYQGIGLLLDGLFGTASGSAASVENAGLLGLTRVGSRRVIEVSAWFMFFFSILGKFGALFASIPLPIFAALYCVLFAYVAAAGLGLLQFCHLNTFRVKFILGFSLFMGLSVAQYFKEYFLIKGYGPVHTTSRSFNDIVNVIFSSPVLVGATVAYILDCTMRHGDGDINRERGWHWWEKFRFFKGDSRSEEFYSLPYNLSKYFPSY
ncbi:hypothetical protein Taro_023766 [Colocasia esculenta]|uniref:Nucleobase-ascorbate transporter 7 n=1 Tax=Colocasia esculenta TaxID=4460 RepID=A0A843V510_COLES|nr:hypothetical protein [Colocasia esculenta]